MQSRISECLSAHIYFGGWFSWEMLQFYIQNIMKFQKMRCIQLCFCLAGDLDPAFHTSLRNRKTLGKKTYLKPSNMDQNPLLNTSAWLYKNKNPSAKTQNWRVDKFVGLHINPTEFNTQKSTNRSFNSNPKGDPPCRCLHQNGFSNSFTQIRLGEFQSHRITFHFAHGDVMFLLHLK